MTYAGRFRRPCSSALAAVLVLTAAACVGFVAPAFAQDPEPYTEDHTYDMYYPKRARGNQPTAWDPGTIDDVNLANGNVTLSIPLGPVLHAGADLGYQLELFYNSKVWSRDKRDTRDDSVECWMDEGKGMLLGDRHIGLGWSLQLPRVFVRRKVHNEEEGCGGEGPCGVFYLDSVIAADGARSQLRSCHDRWECSSDPDPDVWHSADGSDWRVTWMDDGDEEFDSGDSLVGEHGGLRYYFSYWTLLSSDSPEHNPASRDRLVDTDYLSEARGWYCTRIESQRWSVGTPGSAFPAISISYQSASGHIYAPVPGVITAIDSIGAPVYTAEITGSPVTSIEFRDATGTAFLGYDLTTATTTGFTILDRPDVDDPPIPNHHCYCLPDECESEGLPTRITSPIRFLDRVTMYHPEDRENPALEWGFAYFTEEIGNALDREKKGALTDVSLPNRTEIHYQHGVWDHAYQDLRDGDRFLCKDLQGLPNGGPCAENLAKVEPEPNLTRILADDESAGVVDRKVVSMENALLEWTEYFGREVGGVRPRITLLNRWGIPFDFSNLAKDRQGRTIDLGSLDPDYFFMGYNQTVVRRHLIADDDPPADAAEVISSLPYGVAVPEARFDDTIYVFSNGRVIHSLDNCVGQKDTNFCNPGVENDDHYGTLPIDGRLLEVRYYRGSAASNLGFTWHDASAPVPERVETFTYTLDSEDGITHDPPIIDIHSPFCVNDLPPRPGAQQAGNLVAYCAARAESVRQRRATTIDVGAGSSGENVYSARESWFETDAHCDADPELCAVDWHTAFGVSPPVAEPPIPSNVVLAAASHDFTVSAPGFADLGLRELTSFSKAGVSAERWLPSLVRERVTSLNGASDFQRETFTYDSSGVPLSKRQHLERWSDDDHDVVTNWTYWSEPSQPQSYGRLKTAKLSKDETVDSWTGYEYSHQVASRQWSLCDRDSEPRGGGLTEAISLCPHWPTAAVFGVKGEVVGARTIDPVWRRPMSSTDGSGDGLASITYDLLGRITELMPTDASKSPTWLEYPDLRTSMAKVWNDGVARQAQTVARLEFDGLGRISHAARRRELTGSLAFAESDFRHKVFAYDGAGSAWAESNWTAGVSAVPTWFSRHQHFTIVSSIDPFGRPERSMLSDGGKTRTSYAGDRVRQAALYDGATSKLLQLRSEVFDARGNPVSVEEADSITYPDPQGDPVIAAVPSSYDWDVASRLRLATVAGAQPRAFEYDSLGNLTREQHPELDAGTEGEYYTEYSMFNALGSPRSVKHRRDGTDDTDVDTFLQNRYDAAGRILETWVQLADGTWSPYSETTYGWADQDHNVGKPISAVQHNYLAMSPAAGPVTVTHSYSYGDPQGLLSGRSTAVTSDVGGASFTLGYGFDAWGLVTSIAYPGIDGVASSCGLPDPPTVDYVNVSTGLEAVRLGAVSLVSVNDYDSSTGLMRDWSTAVGEAGALSYLNHSLVPDGSRPRPSRISATLGSAAVFDSGAYTYDDAGNITEIAGSAATSGWTYEYDALSRLTRATYGLTEPVTRPYGYDDFGNLIQHGSRSITVDPATNRLTGSGFAYDRRGNLVEEPVEHWTRRFRFDPANRLIAAWATGDSAIDDDIYGFVHDQAGERVAKYRVDNSDPSDRVVQEANFFLRDESGNVLTEFVWVPESPGGDSGLWSRLSDRVYLGRDEAVRLEPYYDGVAGEWSTNAVSMVHDHLGSARAEVRGPGSWTTIDYWPYGEFANQPTGLDNHDHLFTGHEREFVGDEPSVLTSTDYMHARYYSNSLGRFLSVDPVGGDVGFSQSWNRFGYVCNNPIRSIDPTGRLQKGHGYTDKEWKKFDKTQKTAAKRMLARASKLEKKAEELQANDREKSGDLRTVAKHLRDAAAVLLNTGPDAQVANAVDSETYQQSGGTRFGAAKHEEDGSITVNIDHSIWDFNNRESQRALGHEALHVIGLHDQVGSNGKTAYQFGTDPQKEAFRELEGTPKALINPDHIMDQVY